MTKKLAELFDLPDLPADATSGGQGPEALGTPSLPDRRRRAHGQERCPASCPWQAPVVDTGFSRALPLAGLGYRSTRIESQLPSAASYTPAPVDLQMILVERPLRSRQHARHDDDQRCVQLPGHRPRPDQESHPAQPQHRHLQVLRWRCAHRPTATTCSWSPHRRSPTCPMCTRTPATTRSRTSRR